MQQNNCALEKKCLNRKESIHFTNQYQNGCQYFVYLFSQIISFYNISTLSRNAYSTHVLNYSAYQPFVDVLLITVVDMAITCGTLIYINYVTSVYRVSMMPSRSYERLRNQCLSSEYDAQS